MSRQPSNLVTAVVIAAISGTIVLLLPATLTVRLIAALPLLFILPGYAVTAALFPKHTLGIPEQVLFSVGISMAIVIVGGFALHWTLWGLQAGSWVGFLFCITLVASFIAARRWQRTGPTVGTPFNFALDVHQSLLLGMAVLVVTTALILARTPLPPRDIQGYTQLWILPASDSNPGTVRVGIDSMEFTPTGYSLRVLVKGEVVHEWPTIQLQPREKWETNVTLPGNSAGKVEAVLYRLDTPNDIYRRVTLQLEH